MPSDHNTYLGLALEEPEKAGAEGNAAIGSVIVGVSILLLLVSVFIMSDPVKKARTGR